MNSLLGRILVAAAILMSVLLMLFALTRWLGAEQKPEEVQLYQGTMNAWIQAQQKWTKDHNVAAVPTPPPMGWS